MPSFKINPPKLYGAVKRFVMCDDPEIVIAGAAQTGKTFGALWKMNLLAWCNANAQLAIVRKTRASMMSSVLQTWERRVINGLPIVAYGHNNPQWYDYPNGARVFIGGMDDPRKVLSSERDAIFVNQVEELSLGEWEILTTRVTGRAGNIPHPQILSDANPAAPTHWIKSRARSGSLTLIESTHADNPTLWNEDGTASKLGARTMATLDRLTGARKMRLRYGVWAQPEGAIYDIFDEERHKVVAFRIPQTWPRVVGIDPMGAFVAALWAAYDPINGVLHVYREYMEPFGVTTPEHARAVLRLSEGETIFAWVGGGPSERQARLDWQAAGVPLMEPPNLGVWEGIDRVTRLLSDGAMVIHDCCPGLLSEFGSYRRKLTRGGEPTEAIENKESFHGLDCARYLAGWALGDKEEVGVLYAPARIGPAW